MDFCLWINVHRSHKWCGVVVVVWHCWVWPKYFKMIKSNNSTISWAGMLTSIEVTICCYLNTKCLWSNIGSHSSDLPLFRGGGRWGSKFWLPPPMEGGGGAGGGSEKLKKELVSLQSNFLKKGGGLGRIWIFRGGDLFQERLQFLLENKTKIWNLIAKKSMNKNVFLFHN